MGCSLGFSDQHNNQHKCRPWGWAGKIVVLPHVTVPGTNGGADSQQVATLTCLYTEGGTHSAGQVSICLLWLTRKRWTCSVSLQLNKVSRYVIRMIFPIMFWEDSIPGPGHYARLPWRYVWGGGDTKICLFKQIFADVIPWHSCHFISREEKYLYQHKMRDYFSVQLAWWRWWYSVVKISTKTKSNMKICASFLISQDLKYSADILQEF